MVTHVHIFRRVYAQVIINTYFLDLPAERA